MQMNLPRLSRLSGYLALAFVVIALAVIGYALLTLWASELMANVAYYSLIAAFLCFVFWAASATIIAIRRNRAQK